MQAVVNVYCAHKSGTGSIGADVEAGSGDGGSSLLKGFWPLHSLFNFDVNTFSDNRDSLASCIIILQSLMCLFLDIKTVHYL